jgi:hypothetical protein
VDREAVEVDRGEAMMNTSNNTDDVVIAAGSSYFLHVEPDGRELRLAREPRELERQTHCVRVIAVDGDSVVEETTLTTATIPCGRGWEYLGNNSWRRTRQS